MQRSFDLAPSSKLQNKMVSVDDCPAVRVGFAGTGLLASEKEREALQVIKIEKLRQLTRLKVLSYVLEGDERIMQLGMSHTDFVNEFGAVLVDKLVHCRFAIFDRLDAGLERMAKSNWPEERKLEQTRMLEEETHAVLRSMKNAMDILKRAVEETCQRVSVMQESRS